MSIAPKTLRNCNKWFLRVANYPLRHLFGAAAVLVAVLATAGPLVGQPTGSLPPDPTGEWLVANKYARIKIADCGGQLWGVVDWEATPGGVDRKNPDPKLRSRPTLGMPILLGMKRSQVNQWDGQIYNSEDGHTYSANISLLNPNMLRVQGCFLGFLCGGENWTRVEPEPQSAQRSPQAMRAPQPPNKRAANAPAQPEADDVCLRLFGAARLPH